MLIVCRLYPCAYVLNMLGPPRMTHPCLVSKSLTPSIHPSCFFFQSPYKAKEKKRRARAKKQQEKARTAQQVDAAGAARAAAEAASSSSSSEDEDDVRNRGKPRCDSCGKVVKVVSFGCVFVVVGVLIVSAMHITHFHWLGSIDMHYIYHACID